MPSSLLCWADSRRPRVRRPKTARRARRSLLQPRRHQSPRPPPSPRRARLRSWLTLTARWVRRAAPICECGAAFAPYGRSHRPPQRWTVSRGRLPRRLWLGSVRAALTRRQRSEPRGNACATLFRGLRRYARRAAPPIVHRTPKKAKEAKPEKPTYPRPQCVLRNRLAPCGSVR